MVALRLRKRGWYITTKGTPVFYLSGLSNDLSKVFSKSLTSATFFTTFFIFLYNNNVFKFPGAFVKLMAINKVFWYAIPGCQKSIFCCEIYEQNQSWENDGNLLDYKICFKFVINSTNTHIQKFTDFLCVNFKLGWKLLRTFKNPSSSSSPSIQMKNMLSVYLYVLMATMAYQFSI